MPPVISDAAQLAERLAETRAKVEQMRQQLDTLTKELASEAATDTKGCDPYADGYAAACRYVLASLEQPQAQHART